MKMDQGCTIGALIASIYLVGGCSAKGEDVSDGTGGSSGMSSNGGTGTGGKTSSGGASFGGSTSGGATSFGGSPSGGAASGGTGPTAGASGSVATGGSVAMGGSGGTVGGCPAAKGTAADALVYDGSTTGATCTNAIKLPRTGYWFSYNDGTSTQTPAKDMMANFGELMGKGGATDCAIHTKGSTFTKYGGGVGFDLNNSAAKSCPYDASAYTGIQFYAKGTTTGTHGLNYAAAPNTIRVKVNTSTDTGGDEFGGWCTLMVDWTECKLPFASLLREGWGTVVVAPPVNAAAITKIQFEASKEGMADIAPSVSFDFWIDDVAFY